MRAFLKGFFAKHPKYASQDFYISGATPVVILFMTF